jgi:hypothetical protein
MFRTPSWFGKKSSTNHLHLTKVKKRIVKSGALRIVQATWFTHAVVLALDKTGKDGSCLIPFPSTHFCKE